jgi:hypothetical protein
VRTHREKERQADNPAKGAPGSDGQLENEQSTAGNARPLCPSAQPEMDDVIAFGVVGGTIEEPRVAYFNEPQPVSDELLALSKPVKPTEVFRFAAPCAGKACQHFDGLDCRLAKRVVKSLPEAVDQLPPCRLRPRCRWWRQEGKAACLRCPMVVTEVERPPELLRSVADPTSP